MATWDAYNNAFADLAEEGLVEPPVVPDDRVQNAHMYYLLLPTLEDRTSFISFLKEGGVQACFHYVPLHSAPAGERFGSFHGKDVYTTEVSERLVRLPLYYGMSVADRARVIEVVRAYFGR